MTTQDFLASYDAKVAEYLLALCYLLLFVPMWRFVHGAARTAEATTGDVAREPALAARPAAAPLGWFQVPDGVALHPGHAWARAGADGLVTVGMDDFASKLVDPERVVLPGKGDRVLAGQPAFAVGDWVTTVDMLSPVAGEVVEVNSAADTTGARQDPYGAGWLFKVKVAEPLERARLMAGDAARAFLERTEAALALRLNPELGQVLQDGGTPVHGIARALAGDGWATMARHFFRTEE